MTIAEPALKPPPPRTIQLWSDLLCPFAHVLLDNWARAAADDDVLASVEVEHHAFPLELFNGPHPRRGTDTEAVGLGQIAPHAGFAVWTANEDTYPHTVLLAAEAVLAATSQSPRAGHGLDTALRRAFWSESRSITHRAVILEVAAELGRAERDVGLDTDALAADLDSGRFRRALNDDWAVARTDILPGSPTVVLPDGSVHYNPGIAVHWQGAWAAGFPVVDSFDADAQITLLRAAAAPPVCHGS